MYELNPTTMKKLIIFILNLFNRLFVKKAQIKHEQTQTASKKISHIDHSRKIKRNTYPTIYRMPGRIEHKIPDIGYSFIGRNEKHKANI